MPKLCKLSTLELGNIECSYQSGASLLELGREYGFTSTTIKSRLVKYGFNDFREISENAKLAHLKYPQKSTKESRDKISRANKGRQKTTEEILKRRNTQEKKLLDRLDIAEKDGLSKLYLEGYSLGMLQRKYKFCAGVLQRHLTKLGIPLRDRSENIKLMFQSGIRQTGTGEDSPNWKSGRRLNGGYITVWIPEEQKYDREHRIVWERVHNRNLPKGWIVHHLNGIKNDNRPENLIGLPRREHSHVFAEKSKRIRELEEQISQLEYQICDPSTFRSKN